MSNSKHANNKTKNVLVLGQDFIQKIDDTRIYTEKMYSPNFTVSNTTFCLSLHYNGDNSYLFVNVKQVVNFKSQDFKLRHVYPMCLGNISANFNQPDRKSTGIYGYVYYFSIDYNVIKTTDILYIHEYLVKQNNIV